jgi:hypothetical protein
LYNASIKHYKIRETLFFLSFIDTIDIRGIL